MNSDDDLEQNGEKEQPSDPPTGFKVVDRRFWAREDGEDDEPAEDLEKRPSFVEQLETRAVKAEETLAEYIRAYKEKVEVELVQVQERLEREAGRQVERDRKTMILDLLEVLDNFDLSIQSAEATRDLDGLAKGVRLIRDQFLGKLAAYGLAPIDAGGEPFDPKLHEAVAVEEVDDPGLDGRITEVFKPGFYFNEQLLRPAMVRVGRKK